MASICANRLPLLSSVPRPQTKPSLISPAKGSTDQAFSVPGAMGTMSWCAMSAIGLACASVPVQV
ncbi:hypothetical protein D3C87_1587730 [compost metagenome]